jgi:hypothetical protein
MTSTTTLLLGHAVSTWFLTGLIWTIQVVHYPLFAMADRSRYADFAAAHNLRITPLVGPPMVVEALLSVWLVIDPPAGIPRWWAWAGLALVGLVWTSTALLQVPQHGRLAAGFDAQAHTWLVASNWVRTIGWTLRAAIATAMVARLLQVR